MRYLLLIPIVIGILSCETYKDPSINELMNTNVISSSDWTIQNANYITNFNDKNREYSTTLDNGPGKVNFNVNLSAGINGEIEWNTNSNLDVTHVERYFIMEEDIFFEKGIHNAIWEWRILSENAKDSLTYSRAYLKVGNVRIKAKVYDDYPNRIYCYYDKTSRNGGHTYKYQVNFWMIKE